MRNRYNALLAEFGLTPLSEQKAWALSGGEKRRLEVARVMINDPKIILLDEMLTGLTPTELAVRNGKIRA